MLPHCCGITDLNVHVGFEFKVTDRVEFDTADPPWQGFGVLRKMCDVLSHIGCGDGAKDIAAAAHALVACSRKPSEYSPHVHCSGKATGKSRSRIFNDQPFWPKHFRADCF